MTTNFTWTPGQYEALTKIREFLQSDDTLFVLSGSAGTGKTSLLVGIPRLVPKGLTVATAPTHKACHVLREKIPDIDCMTIHSFLGLRPKKIKGQEVLVRSKSYDPSEHMNVTTVICDEASMVDSKIMKFILEDKETWRRKYILVGDRYQLPPVNEKVSPCFALPLPEHCQMELREVVRQAADNPVIYVATDIRNAIITSKEPPLRAKKNDAMVGVHVLKREAWIEKLRLSVQDPRFKTDPDWLRVLAYRNETVITYNQLIRGMLGEDASVPFSKGDVVTAKSPWVVDDEVLMMTGAEFTIAHLEPHTHPAFPQLRGWQVFLEEISSMPIYVLDYLGSAKAYKEVLENLTREGIESGNWSPYYRMQEYYADLRPVYALTIHQSQGSTFTNVMVDFMDIYEKRHSNLSEADKCYYVAVTRATHNVVLLA